jgi:hypothetical protein
MHVDDAFTRLISLILASCICADGIISTTNPSRWWHGVMWWARNCWARVAAVAREQRSVSKSIAELPGSGVCVVDLQAGIVENCDAGSRLEVVDAVPV